MCCRFWLLGYPICPKPDQKADHGQPLEFQSSYTVHSAPQGPLIPTKTTITAAYAAVTPRTSCCFADDLQATPRANKNTATLAVIRVFSLIGCMAMMSIGTMRARPPSIAVMKRVLKFSWRSRSSMRCILPTKDFVFSLGRYFSLLRKSAASLAGERGAPSLSIVVLFKDVLEPRSKFSISTFQTKRSWRPDSSRWIMRSNFLS